MKTVVFIDKGDREVCESFLRYDYVLDEHRAAGTFDVCSWYPEGRSVKTAIPDLEAIVGAEEHWRAIVVCDLRKQAAAPEADEHFDNLFDFPENYGVRSGDAVGESDRALVRLTQMLGGLPERVNIVWPDQAEGEAVVLNRYDVAFAQNDARYDLLQRYRLGVARPETIVCITPRDVDEDFLAARAYDLTHEGVARSLPGSDRATGGKVDTSVEQLPERDVPPMPQQTAFEPAGYSEDVQAAVAVAERDVIPQDVVANLTDAEFRAEFVAVEDASRVQAPEIDPGFWERNGYPPSARFVVCDRAAQALQAENPPESAGDPFAVSKPDIDESPLALSKRDEWFRFWMCVLSLCAADIEPISLKAFKVYSASVDIDEEELERVFSRRYTEWAAMRQLIALEQDLEARRLDAPEARRKEIPACDTTVAVPFEGIDDSALMADPDEVELFKDHPKNDQSVWAEQRSRIMDEFRNLMRAPLRGLHLAAEQFRNVSALDRDELEYTLLNRHQTIELADQLTDREYALAAEVGPLAFSTRTYDKRFNADSDNIKKQIRLRSTRTQTLVAAGVALVALLLGFVPYCLGAFGGERANASAWLLTAACLVVLVVVAFVTLRRMQREVRESYQDFNRNMRSVVGNMRGEALRLGRRLSSYATFRKLWSVYERQQARNEPTERSVMLGYRDALLRTRMEDILKIAPSCYVDPTRFNEIVQRGWESSEDLLRNKAFFSVCEPTLQRGTLNGGTPAVEAIQVPYSFVPNVVLQQIDVW